MLSSFKNKKLKQFTIYQTWFLKLFSKNLKQWCSHTYPKFLDSVFYLLRVWVVVYSEDGLQYIMHIKDVSTDSSDLELMSCGPFQKWSATHFKYEHWQYWIGTLLIQVLIVITEASFRFRLNGEQLLCTSFGQYGRRGIEWPSMMTCFQSRD